VKYKVKKRPFPSLADLKAQLFPSDTTDLKLLAEKILSEKNWLLEKCVEVG